MTVRRTVILGCDGDGCIAVSDMADSTPKLARQSARHMGWTHKHGRDLCPRCTKKENHHGG